MKNEIQPHEITPQEQFQLGIGKKLLSFALGSKKVKSIIANATNWLFEQNSGKVTVAFAREKEGKMDFFRVELKKECLEDERFISLLQDYTITAVSLIEESNTILDNVFTTSPSLPPGEK